MDILEFRARFTAIVNNIPNTNYGSILNQINLMLLVQELYLCGKYSQDEIIRQYRSMLVILDEIEVEAKIEAVHEVLDNIEGRHRTTCVFDDYGEAFISNNFTILNRFIANKSLFNERNK